MADAPIGISFIPSAQNQAQQGPRQAGLEGDLSQAFKILSLRLPTTVGAASPVPQALLTSPGAAGVTGMPSTAGTPSGPYDPMAAVFTALLRSMAGGGPDSMAPMGGGIPHPKISIPGTTAQDATSGSDLPGAMTPPPMSGSNGGGGGGFDTSSAQPENRDAGGYF